MIVEQQHRPSWLQQVQPAEQQHTSPRLQTQLSPPSILVILVAVTTFPPANSSSPLKLIFDWLAAQFALAPGASLKMPFSSWGIAAGTWTAVVAVESRGATVALAAAGSGGCAVVAGVGSGVPAGGGPA